MAQQTALDWYIDKINETTFEASIHFQLFKEGNEYEQAKAMEKEQIIESWLAGENDGSLEPKAFVEMAEQYYNETFEL